MRIVPLVPLLLLLAGCAGPTGSQDDGAGEAGDQSDGGGGDDVLSPGFAPQQGHDRTSHDKLPGLVVEGDMYACEAGFCVDAQAHNEGDATYHVSSVCVSPWSERMEKEGEAVEHKEPVAHCMAFGTGPFAPGQRLDASFSWNGTLWKDDAAAPASGAYQWIIALRVYETSGGDPHDLELSFSVVAGAT